MAHIAAVAQNMAKSHTDTIVLTANSDNRSKYGKVPYAIIAQNKTKSHERQHVAQRPARPRSSRGRHTSALQGKSSINTSYDRVVGRWTTNAATKPSETS